MNQSYKLIGFVLLTAISSQLLCGGSVAPIRIAPTSAVMLVINEIPQTSHKGETAKFAVTTDKTATCSAGISYTDQTTKRDIWVEFQDIKPDNNGVCEWNWIVPDNANPGTASFRVAAAQAGNVNMLPPQILDIAP